MTVREATKQLFIKYKEMLEPLVKYTENGVNDFKNIPHLFWMCGTAIEHIDDWPIDKLSRWLGFVQGIMAIKDIINVQQERDESRVLFHAAYEEENIKIP